MRRSLSWEVAGRSAGQETSCLSCNQKVHCRFTGTHQWTRFQMRLIQSTKTHIIYIRFILIVSFDLHVSIGSSGCLKKEYSFNLVLDTSLSTFYLLSVRYKYFHPCYSLSLTHGAKPFLRSRQLCSYSRTSQHFMEPEGSLPCSQEPSTGPYPESGPLSPYQPILPKIRLNIILLLTSSSS
jgi:hypothetical protein